MKIILEIEPYELTRHLSNLAEVIAKVNSDWPELEENFESLLRKMREGFINDPSTTSS